MKVTTASFTLSLRRRYSCSSSLSVTDSHSVSTARSLSTTSSSRTDFSNVGRRQRGPLRAQELLVPLLADERAVLLERRRREDALPHFLVARVDAEPVGFGERRLLIDQLLKDLLVDAELLQELFADVAAVRVAIRLQLGVVGAAKIAGGDLPALDRGHRVAQAERPRRSRGGSRECRK